MSSTRRTRTRSPRVRDASARQVKLVLLGESAVGKTSLTLRYVAQHFEDVPDTTVGAAFVSKTVQLEDDSVVKFAIWDTAGQEKYRGLAPMYYRKAAAAIVVFDVTSRESFDLLKVWVDELAERGPRDVVVAIAANKVDLEGKRVVTTDEGREYAVRHHALYVETSAKTDYNVTELFESVAAALPPPVVKTQESRPVVQVTTVSQEPLLRRCCS